MLKKLIKLFICLSFCLMNAAVSITAFNENYFIEQELNGYKLINDNGERYILSSDNEKLSLFFDTQGNSVTVDEAFNILTNTGTDPGIQTAALVPNLDPDTAYYDSTSQITGTKKKVGHDVLGPGYALVGYSVSITEGWSASFELTARIKTLVRAEVEASFSGTYVRTTQTSAVSGVVYEVPSGKIGAVYFSPYYNKHKVYYTDPYYDTKSMYYNTPKVNAAGLADGLFSLVTWDDV